MAGKRVGRPKQYDQRTNTSIRFPAELHEAIQAAAEERMVSVNFLVVALCREGMKILIPANEITLTAQRNGHEHE